MMEAVKLQLKNPKDLVQSVQSIQDENAKLKKEIEKLNAQLVQQITELESETQSTRAFPYCVRKSTSTQRV